MNYTYRVIIEPDEKVWRAWVPALPGCHTWGKTVAETEKHAQEAIECHIEALRMLGQTIPIDHSFDKLYTVSLSPIKKVFKKPLNKAIKHRVPAYV